MSRKTIPLEVDCPTQEELIRSYHALAMELNDLARTAPDGVVIDQLEDLVIERGRETLRASLQQAVQKRIDDAEKKGTDPALPLRPQTRKPRQGPASTDQLPGDAVPATALVGQPLPLRHPRRLPPRRRLTLGRTSKPAFATTGLPPQRLSIVRPKRRGSLGVARRLPQCRDAAGRQREARSADGRLAAARHDEYGDLPGGVGGGGVPGRRRQGPHA